MGITKEVINNKTLELIQAETDWSYTIDPTNASRVGDLIETISRISAFCDMANELKKCIEEENV